MSFRLLTGPIHSNALRLVAMTLVATVVACSSREDRTVTKASAKQPSSLLTIIIHEDNAKRKAFIPSLSKDNLRAKLQRYGVRILSWRVALGVGEIITVQIPTGELGAVHRDVSALEGASAHIGFYPTYESHASRKAGSYVGGDGP